MEKFMGRDVPIIIKTNYLRVCRVVGIEDLDDDNTVNCDDVDCDECVFKDKSIAEKYIKTKGKHIPFNECFNKENKMNISDNILTVFEDSATMAGKIANRFGSEYGDTTRDLLALRRDRKDLLAILNAEEDEAKKDNK